MDFKVENSGFLTTHHHHLPFVQLHGPVCFFLAFSERLLCCLASICASIIAVGWLPGFKRLFASCFSSLSGEQKTLDLSTRTAGVASCEVLYRSQLVLGSYCQHLKKEKKNPI